MFRPYPSATAARLTLHAKCVCFILTGSMLRVYRVRTNHVAPLQHDSSFPSDWSTFSTKPPHALRIACIFNTQYQLSSWSSFQSSPSISCNQKHGLQSSDHTHRHKDRTHTIGANLVSPFFTLRSHLLAWLFSLTNLGNYLICRILWALHVFFIALLHIKGYWK